MTTVYRGIKRRNEENQGLTPVRVLIQENEDPQRSILSTKKNHEVEVAHILRNDHITKKRPRHITKNDTDHVPDHTLQWKGTLIDMKSTTRNPNPQNTGIETTILISQGIETSLGGDSFNCNRKFLFFAFYNISLILHSYILGVGCFVLIVSMRAQF